MTLDDDLASLAPLRDILAAQGLSASIFCWT